MRLRKDDFCNCNNRLLFEVEKEKERNNNTVYRCYRCNSWRYNYKRELFLSTSYAIDGKKGLESLNTPEEQRTIVEKLESAEDFKYECEDTGQHNEHFSEYPLFWPD